MQEQWIKWEPSNNLSKNYSLDSISDSAEGLKILLLDAENRNKKVLVSFPHSVHAYRSTDESLILSTISFLHKKYSAEFYRDWSFFKIEKSKYLQWISTQSCGISDGYNCIHFCILASDYMIDIISTYDPTVVSIDELSHKK